ncbi:MAG TPA: 2-C-methyl-D-erythritol 2,4-cyclodiphosphate synthase [Actinomycetota bacterium]|nr:2-C-methyl-D-erythritol 2,4-cyclodiphosphate synthase [Actinomycetota bacterium]
MSEPRVGLGFDLHPPDPSRPLLLAGVRFEGEPGLAGHSDGDAVSHAVADALLGAAARGDLGERFPDTDPAVAGIAGLELLARVVASLAEGGLRPASCDVTVIAARPAVAPRREEMRRNLAEVLGLPPERVSLKATRPEGLGLTGDGVGCLALAVLSG